MSLNDEFIVQGNPLVQIVRYTAPLAKPTAGANNMFFNPEEEVTAKMYQVPKVGFSQPKPETYNIAVNTPYQFEVVGVPNIKETTIVKGANCK